MKVRFSILVVIVLVALPWLGLINPTYSYDASVFPYGRFVSQAGRLLSWSRMVALLLLVMSLLLAVGRYFATRVLREWTWSHVAVYFAALLILVWMGKPLSRMMAASSAQDIQRVYDTVALGETRELIERKMKADGKLRYYPLDSSVYGTLGGFPVDPYLGRSLLVAHHGARARMALWFTADPDTAKQTLLRKALFDKRAIRSMAPRLDERDDRVLIGVLSSTDGVLTFTLCNTDHAYPVVTDHAPMAVRRLVANLAQDGIGNVIFHGRLMNVPPGSMVVDVSGFKSGGRHGTYDQSLYDTCRLSFLSDG